MRVLFAPDSFKGTLSSVAVALALATGWSRARPADDRLLSPLADGGEGTLDAIEAAGGWDRRHAIVVDPIHREIDATFLVGGSGDRTEAIVEMAQASGLSRLTADERDPLGATSIGTGQLLLEAVSGGARRITLGIGGSATNDGGRGILEALGGRVSSPAPDGPFRIDLAALDARLADVEVEVACDVDNPLLGRRGAAATYGPQKGATPSDVARLDHRLGAWADALEAAAGRHERDTPGAGAAGGVGFALLCLQDRFRAFALRPGVELVMAATGFEAKLARADLVLTGEGRIDAQTAFGKTAFGVARRAQAAGVRCIAVGGGVEPDGAEALAAIGARTVAVHDRPISLQEAKAAGAAPVEACAERIASRITEPA
ncbi:MAG TPA: glycerate kinase [Candidatus Limnocylindrales bacterium]|nr:glycerate kinase [Candidatus Limnocylindrales bacterium]